MNSEMCEREKKQLFSHITDEWWEPTANWKQWTKKLREGYHTEAALHEPLVQRWIHIWKTTGTGLQGDGWKWFAQIRILYYPPDFIILSTLSRGSNLEGQVTGTHHTPSEKVITSILWLNTPQSGLYDTDMICEVWLLQSPDLNPVEQLCVGQQSLTPSSTHPTILWRKAVPSLQQHSSILSNHCQGEQRLSRWQVVD